MDTAKFGSLKDTVAGAVAGGYTIIYDNRYKSASLPLNITGAVSLAEWPGLTGKNGGEYEYALDGMKIIAQPALLPDHGLNMRPKDSKEALDVLRQVIEVRKGVGPTVEFLLGGK